MTTVADLLDGGWFSSVEPVIAGWSSDRKYCVTTTDGARYLLRVSASERAEERYRLFDLMREVASRGVPICEPVEIGTCDDGVYVLLRWIDGEDLRPRLPHLSASRQHELGVASGHHLRTMHAIEAPADLPSWSDRFNSKIDRKIQIYAESSLRFEGDQHVLRFLEENRHLLDGRPQAFQHGDYHDGNMMLEGDELRIIDFDRFDFGDPWEEFNRIVWPAARSPQFASGQLHGYFDGDPPEEFFRLLGVYIASNTLSSLPWAAAFGEDEIDTMLAQARDVLAWYDNMRTPIPSWYIAARVSRTD